MLQALHLILLPELKTLPPGLLIIGTDKQTAAHIEGLTKDIDDHEERIPDTQGIGHQVADFNQESIAKGVTLNDVVDLRQTNDVAQFAQNHTHSIEFVRAHID